MARFHRATSLLGLFLLALFVQTPSSADAARTLKGSVGKRDKGAIEINQANLGQDGYSWNAVTNTWSASKSKASSHAAPRIAAHHDYLHRTVHGYVDGFAPKEYSPFVAAVLTYTLIFLPFCLAAALYRELRAMLSVQKLLFVANVYNAIYCACLVILNVVTGNEPMSSLQASNEADYIILQFLKVVAFGAFILLQVVHVWILRNTNAENMKVGAISNLLLSLCVGLHYFLRVWLPAMHGMPPRNSSLSYLLYTVIFSAMALTFYVKPEKGERAQAAAATAVVIGDEEDKQI